MQWFFSIATSRPDKDNNDVCRNAVVSGSVALVEWLRAQGYEWRYLCGYDAGRSGHLPMMQYVHAQGVPITWGCVMEAAKFRDPEIMAWLQTLGFDTHAR